MRTSILGWLGSLALAAFAATTALAQAPFAPAAPAITPATTQPWTGPMQVRDFPGGTFCYASFQTTPQLIAQAAPVVTAELLKAMAAAKVHATGPLILNYDNITTPGVRQVELGYMVPEGTMPAEGFQVKTLPAYRCAALLYTGPAGGMSSAYQQLVTAMLRGGQAPTSASRQYLLYWDSAESPNNVFWITMAPRP
jgi:DNA gyrase inhibitor GyrI